MKRKLGLFAILAGLASLVVLLYWARPFLLPKVGGAEPAPAKQTPKVEPKKEEPKTDASGRPLAWAQPVQVPGVGNCYKVSDELYRGEQPDPKEVGFAELKKLGIKTVVNLRSLHGESGPVKEAGLGYLHIYFNPLEDPEKSDVLQFLRVMADKSKHPVFVHCQHGADRTGTMCAIYRIVVQGWSKEEAVKEMKEGGYGFHGQVYESYAEYVKKLDADALRRELRLSQ